MQVGTTLMEKLTFSLGVAGTAMTIVFGMLLALMFIIKFQSFIINGSTKKKELLKRELKVEMKY